MRETSVRARMVVLICHFWLVFQTCIILLIAMFVAVLADSNDDLCLDCDTEANITCKGICWEDHDFDTPGFNDCWKQCADDIWNTCPGQNCPQRK